MSRTKEPVNLYLALTEALVPTESPALSASERSEAIVEASEFVREQLDALPPKLRVLMKFGVTGFRVLVRLRYVRSFCGLPLERRRRIAAWWSYGPIGLTRQLFRAIRSTALLAYYEHPVVSAKLTEPDR